MTSDPCLSGDKQKDRPEGGLSVTLMGLAYQATRNAPLLRR